MLFGIPENEYPSDILDNDLFTAVRNIYTNAEVKNKLLLFNTELHNLKEEIEHCRKAQVTFLYEPLPEEIPLIEALYKKLPIPHFELNLYCDNPLDADYFSNMSLSLTKRIEDWPISLFLSDDKNNTIRNVEYFVM